MGLAPSVIERFDQLAARTDAWGCTEAEVHRVAEAQGVPLPASYRYFLTVMGRDAGGLFGGSSIAYPEIDGLADVWRTEEFPIPADAVVFSDHQGYQCFYLHAGDGDDPPVWHFMEGDPPRIVHQPRIVAPSLIDLLENELASAPPGWSRQQRERSRRSYAEPRRRAFVRIGCPACDGDLDFHGEVDFTHGARNAGRDRTIAVCRACAREFWRWSDELDTPLRPSGQ